MECTVRTEAYISDVLCIPSGRASMDLGTDYRVYLFRFQGVASPRSELRITFYERLYPVYSRLVRLDGPALRSRHDYDNNVHNSIIYS